MGYLPADSVVKALPSNEGGAGSTPRQENKIQRASWPKNKNVTQKQYCTKFNKHFKNGPTLRTSEKQKFKILI